MGDMIIAKCRTKRKNPVAVTLLCIIMSSLRDFILVVRFPSIIISSLRDFIIGSALSFYNHVIPSGFYFRCAFLML